jgi:Fic family protein
MKKAPTTNRPNKRPKERPNGRRIDVKPPVPESAVPYNSISQMEPMWPAKPALEEKAIELLKVSQELSGNLHPITQRRIAMLLRLMNSYYSNLIEGNVTRPLDLERAQKNDYSAEPPKRSLQLLGRAHIETQEEFEAIVRASPEINICTSEFLSQIHRSFYEKLPLEFRTVKSSSGKLLEVVPGEVRTTNVEIGRHYPPAYKSLPAFLRRFEEVYAPAQLGSVKKILAAAASHHRLAWIHPFLDGNGRVIRLFTHLYFIQADLDSNGLWALSRGLARKREQYYAALETADEHRYNDYDGRGNLSQRGLDTFVDFILDVAIDQIGYMSQLLEIDGLLERLSQYVEILAARGTLDISAKHVLSEVLLRGEIERGEIPRITGKPERTARRITQSLLQMELLTSESAHGVLRLNFPMKSVPFIFPALFPSE